MEKDELWERLKKKGKHKKASNMWEPNLSRLSLKHALIFIPRGIFERSLNQCK